MGSVTTNGHKGYRCQSQTTTRRSTHEFRLKQFTIWNRWEYYWPFISIEILNLCKTNQKIDELCKPCLYHFIIIDPESNIFANEYGKRNKTYINSSFKLKRFIKVFNKTSINSSHVYSIHFKSLLDSLYICDYQFN